jgi:hypothetical protein
MAPWLQLQYETGIASQLHIETYTRGTTAMRDTFATFAALLLAAPQGASFYQAEPAAPARAQVIAGDLVWRCGAAGCTAGKSGARPLVDCQGLVRAVGAVRSFAVAGAPLAADQLEKCNARKR